MCAGDQIACQSPAAAVATPAGAAGTPGALAGVAPGLAEAEAEAEAAGLVLDGPASPGSAEGSPESLRGSGEVLSCSRSSPSGVCSTFWRFAAGVPSSDGDAGRGEGEAAGLVMVPRQDWRASAEAPRRAWPSPCPGICCRARCYASSTVATTIPLPRRAPLNIIPTPPTRHLFILYFSAIYDPAL